MSSAAKTIELLTYFSTTRPEIGLSQFCRLVGRDKATTYRHLQALEETGFVEKNPTTRQYRLGPMILQLAQMREATVPRKTAAEPALAILADTTGETAHVSVLSGTTLYALASCESPKHSTRAIIDIQTFPLHATASGLCTLAFGPQELVDIASENLQAFTTSTVRSADELRCIVAATRRSGFARTEASFEDDINSLSAPVFDQTGAFAGAVAVASVASRFTPELGHRIQSNLVTASREITRNWGGNVPPDIEASWAETLAQSYILEPAS